MKKIATIFLIVFSAFLITPTLVAYIDKSVDISFAYTANEEENSAKNQLEVQYTLETESNAESIHFLQEKEENWDFYKRAEHLVYLEVLSPPPRTT